MRSSIGRVGVTISSYPVERDLQKPAKGITGGAARGFIVGAATPIVIGAVAPVPGGTLIGLLFVPITAVAGGVYRSVEHAQRKMVRAPRKVYRPRKAAATVYRELYGLYQQLHDSFGTAAHRQALGHVMKSLIAIRNRALEG